MTTWKYQTNLNCGNCVAAVKPHLDGEVAIDRWAVDTSTPDKLLTVEGERVTPQRVQELVGRAGFKVLSEVPAPVHHTASEDVSMHDSSVSDTTQSTQSYSPLLLILAYLLGVVSLVEVRIGSFDAMRTMSNFMGGFFIVFSV